jgi:GntR family transcriptional regulator
VYLQIDPSNSNPLYIQIIDQIKHAIAIGVFKVDKPLPTIREMAVELRINPNTVAKAIRELEREGVLKTYVGKGSFVSEKALKVASEDNSEKLNKLSRQFIKDAEWLGFDQKQAISALDENWQKLKQEIKND